MAFCYSYCFSTSAIQNNGFKHLKDPGLQRVVGFVAGKPRKARRSARQFLSQWRRSYCRKQEGSYVIFSFGRRGSLFLICGSCFVANWATYQPTRTIGLLFIAGDPPGLSGQLPKLVATGQGTQMFIRPVWLTHLCGHSVGISADIPNSDHKLPNIPVGI